MRRLLLCILLMLPEIVLANDWDALRIPGAVAIMRHALAPGTGDPAHFDIATCSSQRNLDDRGRAQARAIGAAFKERGITFDVVYTSQWCRCQETATLLDLGHPQQAPALNSFFRDRSARVAQTRQTLDLIRSTRGPIMMVTHQVNISALTGDFTASGEILVIRDTGSGVDVLGSIEILP